MSESRLGYILVVFLLVSAALLASVPTTDAYLVGSGRYDITGPAAEWGMMGYAMLNQVTHGLHFRLRSRAFVFEDEESGKRVAFVNLDACMCFQSVKVTVTEKLQQIYGGTYTADNVLISGIHTHAGPAGYSWHNLYEVTSLGFSQSNFDVIVNGVLSAIHQAHKSVKPASLFLNHGVLLDTNINRSLWSYLNNPKEERDQYPWNVDKDSVTMRIMGADRSDVGMLNFYSVHGTSMNNTNELISGDNKGYAAYLFEKHMNHKSTLPANGPFVSIFAQANEGDVSPNTRGAFCPNGTRCNFEHSTCNGRNELCRGLGPGKTDFESTQIIGRRQYEHAWEKYRSAKQRVTGPVDYIHMHVDMSQVTVSPNYTSTGQTEHTCPAAVGDAMAAGTTDGPGAFDFRQGDAKTPNPFWNWLASFITGDVPAEQKECHDPKPILLNVGQAEKRPSPWVPHILPVQIVRIGSLVILAVPGEFTTMSGRRLRNTVRSVLEAEGMTDTTIVIAGLANAYSQYIATYEEYQRQRYEGASTLFGPHTLSAYQQVFARLARALARGEQLPPGPDPPNLSDKAWSFHPPVVVDEPGIGHHFGEVSRDVSKRNYTAGRDTVDVEFVSANPQNDLRTENSFLWIDRYDSRRGKWTPVCDDGCWETKFRWRRHLIAESRVTITWDIPDDAEPGQYRIRHTGNAKHLFGSITPFSGHTSSFYVSNAKQLSSKKRSNSHIFGRAQF